MVTLQFRQKVFLALARLASTKSAVAVLCAFALLSEASAQELCKPHLTTLEVKRIDVLEKSQIPTLVAPGDLLPIRARKVEFAKIIADSKNYSYSEVVRLLNEGLLDANDRFEEGSPELNQRIPNAVGHTLLTWTIKYSRVDAFQELLRRGADISAKYCKAFTSPYYYGIQLIGPLEFAIEPALTDGQMHFLETLLSKGVNPNFELSDGGRPIHWAAARCTGSAAPRVAARLRYYLADINLPHESPLRSKEAALHIVGNGSNDYCLDTLAVLLVSGKAVNKIDVNSKGYDANLNAQDSNGLLPIDYAIRWSSCTSRNESDRRASLIKRQMVAMLRKAGSPGPTVTAPYCK